MGGLTAPVAGSLKLPSCTSFVSILLFNVMTSLFSSILLKATTFAFNLIVFSIIVTNLTWILKKNKVISEN
ncbi:hypothetical protein D9M71_765300 [compost metagenome]